MLPSAKHKNDYLEEIGHRRTWKHDSALGQKAWVYNKQTSISGLFCFDRKLQHCTLENLIFFFYLLEYTLITIKFNMISSPIHQKEYHILSLILLDYIICKRWKRVD